MGAFIRWVIGWPWCSHKWKLLEEVNIWGHSARYPKACQYVLQCEKCGDIRTRAVRA